MMKPSNQEDIEYIAVNEHEESLAALIKLAVSDPGEYLRALDRDQAKRV